MLFLSSHYYLVEFLFCGLAVCVVSLFHVVCLVYFCILYVHFSLIFNQKQRSHHHHHHHSNSHRPMACSDLPPPYHHHPSMTIVIVCTRCRTEAVTNSRALSVLCTAPVCRCIFLGLWKDPLRVAPFSAQDPLAFKNNKLELSGQETRIIFANLSLIILADRTKTNTCTRPRLSPSELTSGHWCITT